MRCTAVIPCKYDPDVHHFQMQLLEFCDRTAPQTKAGLGPAYLDAWKYDVEPDGLALHVDVGHDPAAARNVLDAALDTGADIVIGSRFCEGGSHSGNWKRKQTSRLAAAACNLVTFHDIADWTSGLRSYSPNARRLLSNYDFTTTGHAWQIESLWVALTAGLTVVETPIHYVAGNSSLSRERVMEAVGLWKRIALA